jgi:hypothetical protein
MKRCNCVDPLLVAEVKFTERTSDDQLRQPVFLDLEIEHLVHDEINCLIDEVAEAEQLKPRSQHQELSLEHRNSPVLSNSLESVRTYGQTLNQARMRGVLHSSNHESTCRTYEDGQSLTTKSVDRLGDREQRGCAGLYSHRWYPAARVDTTFGEGRVRKISPTQGLFLIEEARQG